MKFGLYLPNFGPYGNARVLTELAVSAEAAGWDGFFLWDHITRYWPTDVADAWLSLSGHRRVHRAHAPGRAGHPSGPPAPLESGARSPYTRPALQRALDPGA